MISDLRAEVKKKIKKCNKTNIIIQALLVLRWFGTPSYCDILLIEMNNKIK